MKPSPNDTNLDSRIKSVQDDLDFVSGQISTLSRFVSFGIVALSFTMLSSDSPFFRDLADIFKNSLLLSAFLAMVTILLDYMQYIASYFDSRDVLKSVDFSYSEKSKWRRLRDRFFWIKQIVAAISSMTVIVTMLGAIFCAKC